MAVIVLSVLTGCSMNSAKPLAWYIGKDTAVLYGNRGPRAIARVKIHPADEKKISEFENGGDYVILAICSTSATVDNAGQVTIAEEREEYLTKEILTFARKGKYQKSLDCPKGWYRP